MPVSMEMLVLQLIKRSVRKNCPYCGTVGIASCMHNKTDLCVRCPKCKARWYSRSCKCPECGKVNGYYSDGICIKCYEVRQRQKNIGRVI